eukprot:CAMPEP_0172615518 /NCGR_PEP_ID=MMETSP1068-20121228/60207_1 /TAXON_ID=35684 /ORGANISM="Pseudopedinella elastica, Strain CCMP716" /LENGTH=374 /DNA_ID=CAMNT_0013420685 /DNA_START=23 /DNA_END=1147 /DNA_ORIENTATION=+
MEIPEMTPANVVVALACVMVARPILAGLKQTVVFFASLTGRQQSRIEKYNDMHSDETTGLDGRNEDYTTLVDSYYDLATDFYEWGWGSSFHFATRFSFEDFRQSILRHEYYLAGKLKVSPESHILDCGCGIGGPARNIHRFTGAKVTAVTLNQAQVNRGNALCRKEGVAGGVQLVQADFMKLPFPDNHFDGVFAIESTCHAPDRIGVYKEILRVLKPGGTFACYEWCLTDEYDAQDAAHRKIKKDIEVGDGLPDIVHTSVCTAALKKVGFEVSEARDVALDEGLHIEDGAPWYKPLTPSWNPFDWPRFQFNPVMFRLMPVILGFFELIRVVPKGTTNTQVMLQAGGIGCAGGGLTGCFTPMWLMVGTKKDKGRK